MERTDLVIKKADKGSGTVVTSPEDFTNKARNHLDNGGWTGT